MTTDVGRTLLEILTGLAEPLEQLQDATGTLDILSDLTGWDLADTGLDPAPFVALAGDVAAALTKLRKLDPDKPITFEDILALLPEVMRAFSRLAEIGQHIHPVSGLPQDLGTQFVEDLSGCLIVLALGNFHPAIRSGLELLGVLAFAPRPAINHPSGRMVRPERFYPKLDFNAVAEFFKSPGDALLARFGVSNPSGLPAVQVAEQTFPFCAAFLRDLGISAWALEFGTAPDSVPIEEREAERRSLFVRLPADIGQGTETNPGAVLCFTLFDLPGGQYELVLIPRGTLSVARELGDWRASLSATGQPAGLAIRRSGVEFKGDMAALSVTMEVGRRPDAPPLLRLGESTGIHAELGDLTISGTLKVAATPPYRTGGVRLALKRLRFVVKAAPSDGFLEKTLPAQGVGGACDLALQWSGDGGLKFEATSSLEFTLSLQQSLGPITIQTLTIGITASERGFEIFGAVDIQLTLGPLTARIDRFGLRFMLGPSTKDTVGLRTDLGFKPPNGVGVVIKAQVVTGGGYLYFDVDKEQYAGVLQLEIAEKFSLTAVGLLTTKMPDGSKGFSLLVIISVRFDPGIQLGYGFSLNGLGGLLGVNRTAKAEVLREGLRHGALGSILFPQNVVENAPQIISNLNAIFPPAKDRFLFGPMAIIGWGGSPPLLSMEIGIILELPDPFRLIILGRLRVTLPSQKDESTQTGVAVAGDEDKKEDTPKIKLQLDSLGIIDFGSGDISLDAFLYDSTIGPFTITGGMALRISFGAKPLFLLSIGGYHPAFQAPAGFPSVDRVAVGISKNQNGVEIRLQLSAYFALTSNTVQFGAHLDLYVHVSEFEIIGLLGFDALIQFKPFGLMVSFEAMVSVKAFGQTLMAIGLQLNLTGPSPWHVWGKAHFTLLFFSGTAEFDALIGKKETPQPPPPIDVESLLIKELQNPSNWTSHLPIGENPLVTFGGLENPSPGTTPPSPSKQALIHPLAELHINQRLVPLNAPPLTRYGHATPNGATRFTLTVDADQLMKENVSDWFARAQFYDMTDDAKLAAPSFEQMDSGLRLKAKAGYTCGKPIPVDISPARVGGQTTQVRGQQENHLPPSFLSQVAHLGAAGQAPIRASGPAKYRDPAFVNKGVVLNQAQYRVVGGDEQLKAQQTRAAQSPSPPSKLSLFEEALAAVTDMGEAVMSYSAAQARVAQARAASPQNRMWIVPDISRRRGQR